MTDKEKFRYLMAHPDYWNNDRIRQEADKLGKKMFGGYQRDSRIIVVVIDGKRALRGTASELSQRMSMTKQNIRHYAKNNKTDRFGKVFMYEDA